MRFGRNRSRGRGLSRVDGGGSRLSAGVLEKFLRRQSGGGGGGVGGDDHDPKETDAKNETVRDVKDTQQQGKERRRVTWGMTLSAMVMKVGMLRQVLLLLLLPTRMMVYLTMLMALMMLVVAF